MAPDCDLVEKKGRVRSRAWKNLIFDKQGRSYLGTQIYRSEGWAQRRIGRVELLMKLRPDDVIATLSGTEVQVRDYSHAFPIPWKTSGGDHTL